tara:strand:- start:2962 stop:3660 length:699 start_codon:yes stop_codon:yes gene_type:complete
MKRLAIVPARGGSKRFPGKNWAKLGEEPLWLWTVEVATMCFDTVVFTTDCKKLLNNVTDTQGNFVTCLLRPNNLCTDTSKVIDTVNWIYDIYDVKHILYDEIWLLLPTCPLRTVDDTLKSQKKLKKNECDGIISVTDYEFPPQLALEIAGDGQQVKDWHESQPWQNGNSRSQDHDRLYRPNGALYGMKWESFRTYQNFYKGKICTHYMPRNRSVDIDNKIDLKLAEAILNEQ